MKNNQRCQLALPVRILFHSEKQSITKSMGDVFWFHAIFVAVKFQL